MVNFYNPNGHKSQPPQLRQVFITLSKLFKGIVVFAAADLTNPYIGRQAVKWLRNEKSGTMQNVDFPPLFFFGKNRRDAAQLGHYTGRVNEGATASEGTQTQKGATHWELRVLEDWVHTVNQHLIREMKSGINKRWYLRKFKYNHNYEDNLKSLSVHTIKESVYDRDGRSLVYYYPTFAEGRQLNDTLDLAKMANIVSESIDVFTYATAAQDAGQFRNLYCIRELIQEKNLGETDVTLLGELDGHDPFVKIYSEDDRQDWDGTYLDLDDLLFAYKLTEYNDDNSYILNFLEDQFQKVESTKLRYQDEEDILRIFDDTFNQTLLESDKNWLILFVNFDYKRSTSDNQEGMYGAFRVKCAELKQSESLNIQCARTNQRETGLNDVYLGGYTDWVDDQWTEEDQSTSGQYYIPKVAFLPKSLYSRPEHNHYKDRQIYDFVHEITLKNVTQVLESIEDGTFFIDEEALLLQEQQEQQDMDFEEGLATKKQDDIKVSQQGKKIDASRFKTPSAESDGIIRVTDPDALSDAIWDQKRKQDQKEDAAARQSQNKREKYVNQDNDYDFEFQPDYDENEEFMEE